MTPRRLTLEGARAIAEPILQRHGLTLDTGDLSLLSDGLAMTCDDLDLWTYSERAYRDAYEERTARVAALQSVVDLYRDDVEQIKRGDQRANAAGITDVYLRHMPAAVGLPARYDAIVELLGVERALSSTKPAVPTNRPPKAKNVGAQCVYEVLRENKVEPWPACGMIAEMLRAVGIEVRDAEKVRRSLYDKMQRREVR